MPAFAMKYPATPLGIQFAAGLLALICLLAPCAGTMRAIAPASPAPEASPDAEEQRIENLFNSLQQRTGKITLKDGIAELDVPPQLRYLDPADSRKLLVDIWRNPPDTADDVLGMLIPEHFGEDDEHSWGTTITFLDSGYIKDEDADKSDYKKIFQEMKEGQEKANADREKAGYSPLHLVGWAQPPHYDKQTKKLYWAIEFVGRSETHHGLNYDIRILGRRGALVLSVLGSMEQLGQIENSAPLLLSTVNFNQGHRYADFNPKTDKVAAYGLAGLIGGGLLLAKVGGLKWLVAILLAAKKFVVIGVVAVGAFFKRLFSGGTKVDTDRPNPPTGMV